MQSPYILFISILFIYLCLCWVFIAALGLSLAAESGVCAPIAMHRLPIAVASLVEKPGLSSCGTRT